jgi:flagellar hook-basal body complex protein FliE
MSIAPVTAIEALPPEALDGIAGVQDATGNGFDQLVASLQELNSKLVASQESVGQLALGHTDNLHRVMMNMEQTRLSFELMLAVRNKALEAYQDLMRMQV